MKNNLKLALVGRPNVGKSTLFNRLSLKQKAIVNDVSGVTRDIKYAQGKLFDLEFIIIDTPGLEQAKEGNLEYDMSMQAISALIDADIVCLIVDNLDGLTAIDQFFANLIRKNNENIILIVNKCEKNLSDEGSYYKLGFGEPIAVSAEHNLGMIDLYDVLKDKFSNIIVNKEEIQEDKNKNKKEDVVRLAIIGKPNSGKSTLTNTILNEDRMLTGDIAGLTRESVETNIEFNNNKITLIDTAGLRRRSNIKAKLEKLSAKDTIETIKFANTIIFMIEAPNKLSKQDLNIISYVVHEGRSIIIAINKSDLIPKEDKKEYLDDMHYMLKYHLNDIAGVPIVNISALKKQNIDMLLNQAIKTYKLWNTTISTSKLNDWLGFAVNTHLPPLNKKTKRRLKFKYITQTKSRPPTFQIFVNDPEAINNSYKRYLVNSLREELDLFATPIRLIFRKSKNPYSNLS